MSKGNKSPARLRYLAQQAALQRALIERENTWLQGVTHIGHLPLQTDEVDGWTFKRCRCGFDLALTSRGRIWWLRKSHDAIQIVSFEQLLFALSRQCRVHPRRPRTNSVAEVAA